MKWLPAMLIAAAGIFPGPAGLPGAPPAPAAIATELSIAVERDSGQTVPGRDARYTITVANPGESAQQVTVRASLPPSISSVRADPGGEVGDGYVDWVVSVPPEGAATLQLRGTYREPAVAGQSGGPARVAVTACVVAGEPEHPVVCDTDIADLAGGSPVVMWSLVASGAAVGLAAALAAKTAARRRQRVAPARAT